jgi:hypothetical protein
VVGKALAIFALGTVLLISYMLLVLDRILLFNSIQFFIIYVPSQQPQGQLQTQHSTDIHNYIMDAHNIKSGKLQEHIIAEKQTNK